MKEEEWQAAIATVAKLKSTVGMSGEMTDAQLQAAVGDHLNLSTPLWLSGSVGGPQQRKRAKTLKPLEKRPINHRLALHQNRVILMQKREAIASRTAE